MLAAIIVFLGFVIHPGVGMVFLFLAFLISQIIESDL